MRKKSKGGTRGAIFLEVAKIRLGDAVVLMKNRRYLGAVYLAGYSVECALKWAITQRNEMVYLPADLETHDLQKLIKHTGLYPQMQQDAKTWSLFSALVDDWGPHGRYESAQMHVRAADRLYNQIKQVYSWITETPYEDRNSSKNQNRSLPSYPRAAGLQDLYLCHWI